MELAIRQETLLDFVKDQHGDQVRKYTGEPYCTHPLAVAEILLPHNVYLGTEIALCHDLYEDTDCTEARLFIHLYHINKYSLEESRYIIAGVKELTDVFTKEDFPYLNRELRKKCETARLATISAASQTVKYADLIHNSESIIEHGGSFAKTYLKEKKDILYKMSQGNKELYVEAVGICNHALFELCEKS